MDQFQKEQMLDELITRYGKTQRSYFAGGSIIMFGLSVLVTMVFFFPTKISLNVQIPSTIEAIIEVLGIFLVLELIILILILIDNHKFYKMSHEEKRSYFYDDIKKKTNKICPHCGLIFDSSVMTCSKCGNDLEMSYDYMWVDEEVHEKSVDTSGDGNHFL
jgi:ribosomal protein L37E